MSFKVSDTQIAGFQKEGFLMVPGLFSPEEVELLLKIARADQAMASESWDRKDAQGGISRLTLRNSLGKDVYSACVRSRRIVDTMEKLLGAEVYHLHHKMMLKEPFVGGAWEWHQDYGYWYNDACLFPDMASCMIAVDRASRENGCLQVIQGSHLMGRVNHGITGDQTGADLERVEEALRRLPHVYCEMEPGTGLFFHANLLHRSDQNRSPNPRWSLICCYNAVHNIPFRDSHHAPFAPIDQIEDSEWIAAARQDWANMQGKESS
ncbi:MAG: phytanoyl-CoA dioxygenase family protein [Candidatus Omnitrophica bacterium COP1]|nr:phytanoyl-CoA dioxygenase family protein [Candidatus Omnitrophica bacterium COP1]